MAKENQNSNSSPDTFEITFKNGALDNLKRLASRFGLSQEDDLDDVVAKAVKLLTYVRDAKDGKVRYTDENGDGYFIDINKL